MDCICVMWSAPSSLTPTFLFVIGFGGVRLHRNVAAPSPPDPINYPPEPCWPEWLGNRQPGVLHSSSLQWAIACRVFMHVFYSVSSNCMHGHFVGRMLLFRQKDFTKVFDKTVMSINCSTCGRGGLLWHGGESGSTINPWSWSPAPPPTCRSVLDSFPRLLPKALNGSNTEVKLHHLYLCINVNMFLNYTLLSDSDSFFVCFLFEVFLQPPVIKNK